MKSESRSHQRLIDGYANGIVSTGGVLVLLILIFSGWKSALIYTSLCAGSWYLIRYFGTKLKGYRDDTVVSGESSDGSELWWLGYGAGLAFSLGLFFLNAKIEVIASAV